MLGKDCRLNNEKALMICEDLCEYADYENRLFKIFLDIYERNGLSYKERDVRMKHYPPDYGERTGFYHMICENYQHTGIEEDRKPNLRRCERIKWAKELMEHCSEECDKILVWENERHGKKNILLFCPELDYLVVLAKRNKYLLLTTAYPVEESNRRRDLLKEYNSYKNKQRTAV